jgi:hypothetical protein
MEHIWKGWKSLAKWLANAAFMSYTTDKTMDELEI